MVEPGLYVLDGIEGVPMPVVLFRITLSQFEDRGLILYDSGPILSDTSATPAFREVRLRLAPGQPADTIRSISSWYSGRLIIRDGAFLLLPPLALGSVDPLELRPGHRRLLRLEALSEQRCS